MGRAPKFDDGEILDRAMEVFWRRGWSHTSIRNLEHALEMKAPSIYRRFGTKDGLGVAVTDHYVEHVVRRRVQRHLSGTGDPLTNISNFLERSVSQPDEGQRLWGCLLTTIALEAEHLDGDLAQAVERGLAEIQRGLHREVMRAAGLGRLASGVAPESAVAMLILATQGLMVLARSGSPAAMLQQRARAAVAVIAAS